MFIILMLMKNGTDKKLSKDTEVLRDDKIYKV